MFQSRSFSFARDARSKRSAVTILAVALVGSGVTASLVACGGTKARLGAALRCGDGEMSGNEACDDGNTVSGDGCTAVCTIEGPNGSIFSPGNPLNEHLTEYSMSDPIPDEGTFRIGCSFSHVNYDDAIVYPGNEGAAHLHMYFGNQDANYETTPENIRFSSGSTCQGGPLNLSAYWIPTVLRPLYEKDDQGEFIRDGEGNAIPTGEYAIVWPDDIWQLDENGVPVLDDGGNPIRTESGGAEIYYKRSGPSDEFHEVMPTGLRMIAGNMNATPDDPQETWIIRWNCHEEYWEHDLPSQHATIPPCHAGQNPEGEAYRLELQVFFPQCWDGVNLDSPDHKSHMAYRTGSCPATHPVPLPQVTYNIYYTITEDILGPDGDISDWFLSSDGYAASPDHPGGASLHGDWFMAWEDETIATWTQFCVNEARHCSNGDLGNGWALDTRTPGRGNDTGLVPMPHFHP